VHSSKFKIECRPKCIKKLHCLLPTSWIAVHKGLKLPWKRLSTEDYCILERLWNDHDIRQDTKVAVYKAAVLTSLLYGCESWVLYRRHFAKLEQEQFHMHCPRPIAHVKWQDHIPNTEVLQICSIFGTETFLISVQLRWSDHVIRMSENRLSTVSLIMAHAPVVGSGGDTRTCCSTILRRAVSIHRNLRH